MENRYVPLLLVAIPVFFLFLAANSIWDANEAFYVETPRQMVLTGDYVNPTFNAQPRFNKPVLSYWVVAGMYRVFGMTDPVAVERIGIAIGGVGIIVAAFLAGRALRSTSTGVLAALIVATAPRFVMTSRRIFIDVYLSLFLSLALAFFVMALREPERRRRYLIAMYVAIGLGVLTKGPVAIALPALACAIWLVMERRIGDVRHWLLVPGALIILAIVLPWYVLDYRQNGWVHIKAFLFSENIERMTTAMAPPDRRPWFYLQVLLTDLFPWAPLIVVPLATAWRRAAANEVASHVTIRRLLWCWIVTFVVFFSLSATKLDLYILPVTIAVAALIADMLIRAAAGLGVTRSFSIVFALAVVSTLVVAAGIVWLFTSGYYALTGAWPGAIAIAIGALAALVLQWRGQIRHAVAALAAGFVIFNYLFVSRILPDVERLKPVPPLARTFKARAAPDARVGFYGMDLPSIVFYFDRPAELVGSLDQAQAFFRDGAQGWMVTDDKGWADLRARLAAQAPDKKLCVAEQHPLLPARVDDYLSPPPPAVLLITDACR